MGERGLVGLQGALLTRLESQVHFPAWLVARGFQIVPEQRDHTQLAMAAPNGEVLHLRKDLERGGWTYLNTSNTDDRGSISDFMRRQDGSTLESCVSRLGRCAIRAQLSPEGIAYHQVLRDRDNSFHAAESLHVAAVTAEREATRALERLGVDRQSLDEGRFGRVQNQRDVEEIFRNPPAIRHSRYRLSDRALVFVERPIDAIAHERAHGRGQACYVYTGENPSPEDKRKLAHLLAEVPEGMRVVLALGRHLRGNELATEIVHMAPPALKTERVGPEFGSRWSEQMQIENKHRKSLERASGSPSRGM